MLSAKKAEKFMSFDCEGLSEILEESGYLGMKFRSCSFRGITSCREFVYAVEFLDEFEGKVMESKVFVSYDENRGTVAEF